MRLNHQSQLRVGIVGMGIRGQYFARVVDEYPRTELVAVAEIDSSRLTAAINQFKVKGFRDYEELLEQEMLDVLCVTTPDFAHTPIIVAAAERGLDLFVEKPLVTTLEDCEIIENAVSESGVQCMVAFAFRWSPPFIYMKRSIESGSIGDIVTMATNINDAIYVPTEMISWAALTSPAWFLMSHSLDLLLWLSGKKVDSVFAVGVKKLLTAHGIETFDTIRALLKFKDGTDAYLGCSWVLPNSMPRLVDFNLEMIGTSGALQVNTHYQMVRELTDSCRYPDTSTMEVNGKVEGEHTWCLHAFLNALIDGNPPPIPLEDALRVSRILCALHESIEQGSVIHVADDD